METGAITGYIDVAQVVLYVFWGFFFCLVVYLLREGKREGYPLDADGGRADTGNFLLSIPEPKTYQRSHGGTYSVPDGRMDDRAIAAKPFERFPGSPLQPTGNPLVDGVGPAAWAVREDVPDMTYHGDVKIVPMRAAADITIVADDPDPRGMTVIAADGVAAGKVVDCWVDKAEVLIRYLEVELEGGDHVLAPITLARVNNGRRQVAVKSITAAQFKDVPRTKNPEQVTLLEEDKICAYYGGGHLYATAGRLGPVI